MPLYTDALNRKVHIVQKPQRIISLVPSITELLFDLHLRNEVVGITKFCIHPAEWFTTKTRIGGTKNLRMDKIKSLAPDLILANKEENVKEQIEELEKDFPVWVSDVNNLQGALKMIEDIGIITGKNTEATFLKTHIEQGFQGIAKSMMAKVCYLIWKDPYMTVGGDTFINDMLQQAGFCNMYAAQKRYPTISMEELKSAGCPLLLLSSEPYPFAQKHINELQLLLPQTKILLVDGEMFSWYGSRLQYTPAYFLELQQQAAQVLNNVN